MAASSNYTDNVVDIPLLQSLIGTDYANQSVLIQSGAMMVDDRPLGTGTNVINVRRRIFETDSDGQTPASDGELSFQDVKDTEFRAPICIRADGAILNSLQGEISVGGKQDPASLAMEIRAKAAQMIDTAAVKALEGICAANTGNNSGSATTLALTALNTARWIRGDRGNAFQNGVMVLRSELMTGIQNAGLTVYTSNLWGQAATNMLNLQGMVPTIQGLYPFVTNKLTVGAVATDHYAYLLEKGALIFRGSEMPTIQISDIGRGFGYYIKFYVRFAIGCDSMGWSGTGDMITNTDLSTAASWSLKGQTAADVKIARWQTAP